MELRTRLNEEGLVSCVVEKAYFQGAAGEKFVATEITETETHIHQSFIVPDQCGSQFAHRGFPALFMTRKTQRWRKRLEERQFIVRAQDMWDAARETSECSATKRLMRIPKDIPPYLEKALGVPAFA